MQNPRTAHGFCGRAQQIQQMGALNSVLCHSDFSFWEDIPSALGFLWIYPFQVPLDFISTVILVFQVLKLTHLPQTLTIHLLRFSIRDSRTEKICHSLYFPQSLDLSQVLLIEEDLCNDEEQVRSSSLPFHSPFLQTPCPLDFAFPPLRCLRSPTQQRWHF